MSRALRAEQPVLACQDGSGTHLSLRSAPTDFRASYDPVNGVDGDAGQGYRFVGAAARGSTTRAQAAAQTPGQFTRYPGRPARPESGRADREAEWRGGADRIAAQRHRRDGGPERAG